MEVAKLSVLIGGDIAPLTAALDDGKGQLINFARLSSSIEQLRPFSGATASAIQASRSIQDLTDVLVQLKIEQAAATNPKELLAYNTAIKSVTTELQTLGGQGKSAIASVGKELSSSLGFVRQLAYILPGIGMAGIFNLAFEAISKAVTALKLFNSESDEAKRYTELFNDTISNAAKDFEKASESVLKLEADVKLAKDGFINKEAVVRKYNETLGQAIGYASSLDGVEKSLAANAGNYIHATFLKAVANSALEESAKKAFEAEQIQLKQPSEYLTGWEKFNNTLNSVSDNLDQFYRYISNGIIDVKDLPTPYTGIIEQNQAAKDALTGKDNAFAIYEKYITDLEQFSKTHKLNLSGFDDSKTKVNIDKVAEALKNLSAQLKSIPVAGKLEGLTFIPITEQEIKAIGDTIKKLIELGLPEGGVVIQGLELQMENLKALIPQKELVDLNSAIKDKLRAGIGSLNFGITTPVVPLIGIGDEASKKLAADRTKQNEQWAKELQNIEKLGNGIRQIFQSIFTDLLTKGKISFQSIEQALGSLIAKLAATVAEAAILSLILNAIAPGSGGAFSFGKILGQLSGLPTGHAEGGIFTQPTLIGSHLFGEAGAEALIPLSRMNELTNNMGGNNVNISGNLRISNNDLVLALNRGNVRISRGYGNNFSN